MRRPGAFTARVVGAAHCGPAFTMGCLCSTPTRDVESETAHLSSGPRIRNSSHHKTGGAELSKPRGVSISDNISRAMGPPRVHKTAPRLLQEGSMEYGVQQRLLPLKDCPDAILLAELEHRNIRLHEKVTETLVQQRYQFGKLLGQGASAAVYQAFHKKSKMDVAIKVIKKNGDMNDDESMATELEILKLVHHR